MIWEDEKHIAFLSIFPNTDGFTVVATKDHYPSYNFDLPDHVLSELVLASKKVGKLLDRSFDDVGRTGLIMEGFGVDHVHTKLVPMHGTGDMKEWKPVLSSNKKFFQTYEGYLSSHDCEKAPEEQLAAMAAKIRSHNKS
jgi:diadenosine tetraphosphate (Ap4A) HIT family hydrolase